MQYVWPKYSNAAYLLIPFSFASLHTSGRILQIPTLHYNLDSFKKLNSSSSTVKLCNHRMAVPVGTSQLCLNTFSVLLEIIYDQNLPSANCLHSCQFVAKVQRCASSDINTHTHIHHTTDSMDLWMMLFVFGFTKPPPTCPVRLTRELSRSFRFNCSFTTRTHQSVRTIA